MTWWATAEGRLARRMANRRASANFDQVTAKAGLIRVRVMVDAGNVERKFRSLPAKMQRSIRRRAMRKGLSLISNALKRELARHRTDWARPHLADNVAIVTRNYRKSRSRGTYLLYGAAGIRFGGAPLKAMAKAAAAAGAGGIAPHAGLLPGWRWHFMEKGTRRSPGRRYLERISAAARLPVTALVRDTVNKLVRTGT